MEPLQNSLGFWLNVAARQMNRALSQQISEFNLTTTQYITLWCLWESGEELPLSQLGKRLFLDNPTITGIVDRMERDGFLERVPDANDRRVIKVRLTKKGLKLKEHVGEAGTSIDENNAKLIDTSLYTQFMNFLQRLTPNNNDERQPQ